MTRPNFRTGASLVNISIITGLLLWSVSPANAQRMSATTNNNDDGVKLRANIVNLNVSVIDPDGRFVRGLSKDNFEVYEDKTKQNIDLFAFEDLPISIGFIFDYSGSMKNKIERSRQALQAFTQICNPDDEMFLIGFHERPELLVDFTKDDHQILNSVAMQPAEGTTAAIDAVYMGVEKLKQAKYSRKVLLIISDGIDNTSRYTDRELKKLVKESDVTIFSIGLTSLWQQMEYDDLAGMVLLDDLSKTTGGAAYFPRDFNQMTHICNYIGAELRNQYSLAYTPTNANFNGKWRKLKVRVKGMKDCDYYKLRSRDGYFARQ